MKNKKLIGLIALTFVFTCCDVGVRQSTASTSNSSTRVANADKYDKINRTVKVVDGVEYHIYTKTTSYGSVGGVHVVNHTKEKLEVELLKIELSKYGKEI